MRVTKDSSDLLLPFHQVFMPWVVAIENWTLQDTILATSSQYIEQQKRHGDNGSLAERSPLLCLGICMVWTRHSRTWLSNGPHMRLPSLIGQPGIPAASNGSPKARLSFFVPSTLEVANFFHLHPPASSI